MSAEFSNFPALIYLPYKKSLENTIQRRDYQRLCVETLLRFLSIISISDYSYLHKKTINTQEKLEVPKGIDLSQISLGRWNMIARTISNILADKSFVPEIRNLYSELDSDWEQLVSSYITARNHDAHSGLILDETELEKELDRRQMIIRDMLNRCEFLCRYRIIFPIETISTAVGVSYRVKTFTNGSLVVSTIQQSDSTLDLFKPYLYQKETGKFLSLYPMFIHLPKSGNDTRVFGYTYYKTVNRKKGILQYMNNQEIITIARNDKKRYSYQHYSVSEDFFNLRMIIEDESLLQEVTPSIQIKYKLKDDFITKEDNTNLEIIIKNNGDTVAEDINFEIKLPIYFEYQRGRTLILKDSGDDYHTLAFEDIDLEPNSSWKTQFEINPTRSGQYEFPPLKLNYSYTDVRGNNIKPELDQEGSSSNTEYSDSLFCTVIDPTDVFSIIPVVNMSVSIDYGLSATGVKLDEARIGEVVNLSVNLQNTGLGVAKNVDFTVFLPEGVELKNGSETWHGNLNPRSNEEITFELVLKKAGIQYIRFRELVYYDYKGKVYSTFHGGYKVLVRNNPIYEFRQLLQTAWGDLVLADEENLQLQLTKLKYKDVPALHGHNIEEMERDVKVEVIKHLIRETAERMKIKLVEKVFKEGFDLFAISEISCPFAIIQYWQDEVKIFLRGDFSPSEYTFERIGLKHQLNSFDYAKIDAFSPSINSDRFKGMVGKSIRWMLRYQYPLYLCKQVTDKVIGLYSANTTIDIEGNLAIYRIHGDLPYNYSYPFKKAYFCLNKRKELCIFVSTSGFSKLTKDLLAIDDYSFYRFIDKYVEFPFKKSDKENGKYLLLQARKAVTIEEVEECVITLQQFVLDLLQIKSLSLRHHISSFTEPQKHSLRHFVMTYDKLYKELSERVVFRGWFLQYNRDENRTHVDFYTIKAFPLFKSVQKTIRITVSPKRLYIHFRGLSDNVLKKKGIKTSLSKTAPYHYKMILSAKVQEMLPEIILNNLLISSMNIQPLSEHLLKMILEESRISSFDVFLQTMLLMHRKEDEMTFSNINSILEEHGIFRTPQKFISVSNRYFSSYLVESPLKYSYSERTLSLKEDYIPMIEHVLNNYQRKLPLGFDEFHKFKRFIQAHSKRELKLQYLDNPTIAKLHLNTERLKPSRKQLLEIGLINEYVKIEFTLNIDYPFSRDLLSKYNSLKNQQRFKNVYFKKTSRNMKLGIQVPYKNVENLISKNWQKGFQQIYNRLIDAIVPAEKELLHLD